MALSDLAALRTALAAVSPDFGWFDHDLTALATEALPSDLDQIDRGGALRQAAEALLAQTTDPTLSGTDRGVAAAALSRLYALAQEVQA